MKYFEILSLIGQALLLLTGACYFYQILYLFIPFFARKKQHTDPVMHHYAILIAARNEEGVLPHLLASIAAQDYPAELITTYVVADNCTDHTAQIARAAGAVVYERFDSTLVGKGYALHHLLRCIAAENGPQPDIFLIVDADNLLEPNYLTAINRTFSDGFDAVCGCRNSKNFMQNWISSSCGIWYLHDSIHLNASRMLLGTTCAVSGTGFGLTRHLMERCGDWEFFTLTEDIEFNAWCAVNGVRIGFCPDAILYDEQPASFVQSWRQRTRWVQGGIQVSFRYGGRLLRGVFGGSRTPYACFESLTLSLWGYGLSALVSLFCMLILLFSGTPQGLLRSILVTVAGGYLTMLLVAILTVAAEWQHIQGSSRQKIGSCFTFPLFMITYLPIAATALFRPFVWHPIEHTEALSLDEIKQYQQVH